MPEPNLYASDRGDTLHMIVVVPCLDEAPTVGRVVTGVPRDIPGIGRLEIIVIDDGSSDGTGDRAREAGAEVVRHHTTLGLGATFQQAIGIAIARNVDVLVHIDGDGQFDPGDIPLLVKPVVGQQAHMATASRFLDSDLVPRMPIAKRWGNRGVAGIVRLLTGRSFRDVSCGFRAFSREALLRMNLFGTFTYTQECFLDLIFKGLTIVEVPAKVRGVREFGTSRVASSLPKYAYRSLQIMLRAFISYRPFSFFFTLGTMFVLAGLGFLAFLGARWLLTGGFTPYVWTGFVEGSLAFLGVSTYITALLADMLVRIRLNQEHLLYQMKRSGQSETSCGELDRALSEDLRARTWRNEEPYSSTSYLCLRWWGWSTRTGCTAPSSSTTGMSESYRERRRPNLLNQATSACS